MENKMPLNLKYMRQFVHELLAQLNWYHNLTIMQKRKEAVNKTNISWQKHSLQRMLERNISRQEVKEAVNKGKIIEEYFDDNPFPKYSSRLLEWHIPFACSSLL